MRRHRYEEEPESQTADACAWCGSEETRWQSAALCAIDIGSAFDDDRWRCFSTCHSCSAACRFAAMFINLPQLLKCCQRRDLSSVTGHVCAAITCRKNVPVCPSAHVFHYGSKPVPCACDWMPVPVTGCPCPVIVTGCPQTQTQIQPSHPRGPLSRC